MNKLPRKSKSARLTTESDRPLLLFWNLTRGGCYDALWYVSPLGTAQADNGANTAERNFLCGRRRPALPSRCKNQAVTSRTNIITVECRSQTHRNRRAGVSNKLPNITRVCFEGCSLHWMEWSRFVSQRHRHGTSCLSQFSERDKCWKTAHSPRQTP